MFNSKTRCTTAPSTTTPSTTAPRRFHFHARKNEPVLTPSLCTSYSSGAVFARYLLGVTVVGGFALLMHCIQ